MSLNPPTPPRRPPSRAHEVVTHVSRMIEDGRIKPGERIPSEAELIASLGVSRSVVREAVSHLQAAGMVETHQGRGTFAVAGTPQRMGLDPDSVETMHDVLSVLELRIMLEAESAGFAAARATEPQLAQIQAALANFLETCHAGGDTADADTTLHLAIAHASNNRYLEDTLQHLGRHFLPRTRLITSKLSRDAPSIFIERVMREHEDIVNAIARRDPESARAAMRTHLSNSRERLRRAFEQNEAADH